MCCRPIFCKCWNTKTPILFPCKCEHGGWLNVFHHSFSLNIDVSATFAFNWILGMPGQTFISGEWQPCSTCFCGHRLSSSWCPTFIICPPLHHLLLFTACYCAFLFNQIFRAVGPYSWMFDLLSFSPTAPQGREPRSPEHLLRWAPCRENLSTESKIVSFLCSETKSGVCFLVCSSTVFQMHQSSMNLNKSTDQEIFKFIQSSSPTPISISQSLSHLARLASGSVTLHRRENVAEWRTSACSSHAVEHQCMRFAKHKQIMKISLKFKTQTNTEDRAESGVQFGKQCVQKFKIN